MKALGRHFLIDYHRCDPEILSQLEKIKDIMIGAANLCGATVLASSFHNFSPQGVSGVVVIAESHIAIHTWPEYEYAAADIFTCGSKVDPWVAYSHIKRCLDARETNIREIERGELPQIESRVGHGFI
ncbi:adenosylmethionine decarboxylase [Desulfobacterota bacterium AH_259_B03_O07]|nr:adenosylmethionine decarboxylase [Desulfobacterota bacterium AH_259_B03_O07]